MLNHKVEEGREGQKAQGKELNVGGMRQEHSQKKG